MRPTTAPTMSHKELESDLLTLFGQVASTHCRWLFTLAELDSRQAWPDLGFRSGVHWLCRKMGLSRRAAMDHLRVARALAELPLVTTRFSAGGISYSKVRAITRIATRSTEDELLSLASVCTAGQLERIVRLRRRDASGSDQTQHQGELRWRWDEDGSLQLQLRLPAAQGKLLVDELKKLVLPADQADGPESSAEPLAARRAAALLTLITGGRAPATSGRRAAARQPMGRGDQTRPSRHGRPRPRRTAANRARGEARLTTRSAEPPLAVPMPAVPTPRPSSGGRRVAARPRKR
jgi:hypothetical protein